MTAIHQATCGNGGKRGEFPLPGVVDAAEIHYKTLIARIMTEKCSFHEAKSVILDEREGIDITLVRAETWWPPSSNVVVPRLIPSPIAGQSGYRADGLHDL